MNCFSWDAFKAVPLIGILRGFESGLLPEIVRSCMAGGLTCLEVTMNSSGATEQIREAVKLSGERLNVGAGTVLNLRLLEAALAAGASFIVTPGLQPDVVRACLARQVPVFPGVFTPTEIVRAMELGVGWVKVFPAEALGLSYFRALTEAFPQIKLLPTGGVSLASLPSWLDVGAAGCGIGSPLFAPDRIRAQDWEWLKEQCRAFVRATRRSAGPRELLTQRQS